MAPSNGIKRGVVVNIDATVQSIQQACAKPSDGRLPITRVYTGITGSHIRGINSSGMVAVKDREVTGRRGRVVETAKAINISTDQRLLLGAAGVHHRRAGRERTHRHERHPPGGQGAHRHGAQSAAENIIKCVRRCGLEVDHSCSTRWPAALLGADRGRSANWAWRCGHWRRHHRRGHLHGGAIRHTAVIPIAGDLITSDIAMALRTPTKGRRRHQRWKAATPSKLLGRPGRRSRCPAWATATRAPAEPPGAGRRDRAAVEEIFSLVNQVIRDRVLKEVLSSGIVLTGGSAVMPGMVELAEDIFLKPVRRHPQALQRLADMVAQPRGHGDGVAWKKRAWHACAATVSQRAAL